MNGHGGGSNLRQRRDATQQKIAKILGPRSSMSVGNQNKPVEEPDKFKMSLVKSKAFQIALITFSHKKAAATS